MSIPAKNVRGDAAVHYFKPEHSWEPISAQDFIGVRLHTTRVHDQVLRVTVYKNNFYQGKGETVITSPLEQRA